MIAGLGGLEIDIKKREITLKLAVLDLCLLILIIGN